MSAIDFAALDRHWNCQLSVRGRKTGVERSVTIWFALGDGKIFLTGDAKGPQWLRNARANPDVIVKIGNTRVRGRARVVEDPAEAESVRQRFVRRYLMARLARMLGSGYTDSTAVVVDQLEPVA
jgi:deazaflavin-dependent oxidoreductase (nitroreductase family)